MSFPRYPEYKDSGVAWLGEVPGHWDVMQSRRMFAQRKDRAIESDQQLTASQKYGILYQADFMVQEDQKVVQVIHGADILKHVEPNDFVISMRSFQGGIEWSGLRGSISSAYVMLVPIKHVVPEFFRYLLKSNTYIQALQSTTNLVRDGQALRYDNFTQVDLPVLPIEEQTAIATFLDRETGKIDALVAEQEKLIALLKEKRQAVISHTVTKGLNPNAKMKDSGIEWLGEVPEHWEVKRIKAVASCNDEVLGEYTPTDYEIEYVEISGVDVGRGITSTEIIPFGNAPSRARRRVKDGDVLVSTVRTYLRAIAPVNNPPENMIASTGFAVIRPLSITPHFLGYLFQSEFLIAEVIARSVGVSYPAINASDLMRLHVPIPRSEEQQTITAFLDRETAKLDTLTAEAQRGIALLKERRSALISAAVTGKIDVRGNAAC